MQDAPAALEILDTVIAHLRDRLLPTLEGRALFEMRVSLSALELVRRQILLQPQSDAAELERLQRYFRSGADLRTLNEMLCTSINAGTITVDSPWLLDHLYQTALEKLAIDQPSYAAYRRAITDDPPIDTDHH